MKRLRVGLSPCPNDTFVFGAWILGRSDGPPADFVFADVEELNRRVLAGEFDVAKVSFPAAFLAGERYRILPVGAALGYGVGPLLVRAGGCNLDLGPGARVLAPGRWTTATHLYRGLFPDAPEPRHVVFDRILPMLERREADFGVIIHEGRFTFLRYRAELVADLGEIWERRTGLPLPLGGIVIRASLGEVAAGEVIAALRGSLAAARANPGAVRALIERHASELDPEVIDRHIALYVNETSEDLGEVGLEALEALRGFCGR